MERQWRFRATNSQCAAIVWSVVLIFAHGVLYFEHFNPLPFFSTYYLHRPGFRLSALWHALKSLVIYDIPCIGTWFGILVISVILGKLVSAHFAHRFKSFCMFIIGAYSGAFLAGYFFPARFHGRWIVWFLMVYASKVFPTLGFEIDEFGFTLPASLLSLLVVVYTMFAEPKGLKATILVTVWAHLVRFVDMLCEKGRLEMI
jgi:hypothetical protein